MITNHAISSRRLKPFKRFLADGSLGQRQALGKRLCEEEPEAVITGASAIVIDSTATEEERADVLNDFVGEITNLAAGKRVLAIAVVCD